MLLITCSKVDKLTDISSEPESTSLAASERDIATTLAKVKVFRRQCSLASLVAIPG